MLTNDFTEMASDSNKTSSIQHRFISELPSEIVVEIFLHLDQADCLACMAVCRDWYNSIPQYAQHIWQHLQLDTRDISRDYKRRDKCLGGHVKNVALRGQYSEAELFALMEQLLDCGCTDIQSLELIIWVIVDKDTFVKLLQQLAPRLTHLKLTDCHFNTVPMYLFDACPELIQFTCRKCDFLLNDRNTNLSETPVDKVTKITHLILDAVMKKEQVKRILRMCPELQSFIGASEDPWINRFEIIQPDTSLSVDPGTILTWCPKVNFLVTSFCYNRLDNFSDDPNAYTGNGMGLRYFNVTARYGLDQIAYQLMRNQQTLESLCIHHYAAPDTWPSALESLVLPRLHTLALKHHYCSAASLINRLNRCPALETFELCTTLDIYSPITQPLNTMHRLRTLRWKTRVFLNTEFSLFLVVDRSPALETLDIFTANEEFTIPTELTGLKQLKHLAVDGFSMQNFHHPGKKAAVTTFFKYLADYSQLETIRFANVSVLGYSALLAITAIPTLKILDIQLDFDLRDRELVEFIQLLSGTVIESITFHNACRLPFAALKALAELPLLTKLSTQVTRYAQFTALISQNGLKRMLYTSPRLTSVSFDHHVRIEENGDAFRYDQISRLINQCNKLHDGKFWKFELESRSMDGLELFRVDLTKKRSIVSCL